MQCHIPCRLYCYSLLVRMHFAIRYPAVSNLTHGCTAKTKETAYKTLVRPVLDYASCAWDPYKASHIKRLEAVQRKAARFIKGDFRTTSSVDAMLEDLGFKELGKRRRDLRLALLFKIASGQVGVDPEDIGITAADVRTRAPNSHKFRELYKTPKTDVLKHSFSARTVRTWNTLPAHIVELDSPDAFKAELSRLNLDAPKAP